MALPAHSESGVPEDDSLAALEERIRRTVELVHTLKAERDAAIVERNAAILERDAARELARNASGGASAGTQKLRDEIDTLRSERKQVRTRIEKLLGQMDLLSGQ